MAAFQRESRQGKTSGFVATRRLGLDPRNLRRCFPTRDGRNMFVLKRIVRGRSCERKKYGVKVGMAGTSL